MKQLVILSGKGGTGKTSIAAAFAHLAYEGTPHLRAVLADADVDAANLELVLQPDIREVHEFIGGSVAIIDAQRCDQCGLCAEACRFEAIRVEPGYHVDPIACEGCAACFYACPTKAITMERQPAGRWYRSQTRFGPLFHAELRPAQENSGKLVTLVKQQARLHALDGGYQVVIVDGPPGIGCPVISAASGADLALIIAEPSVAGVHDMQRAVQTTTHFRVPTLVCINKADVYRAGSRRVAEYCGTQGIPVVGRVPFDPTVTEAMVQGNPVTSHQPDAPASRAIAALWNRVAPLLDHPEGGP